MGGLWVRFHLHCRVLLVLADIKGLVSRQRIAALQSNLPQGYAKRGKRQAAVFECSATFGTGARTNEVRECGIPP
jgi:hypothetical protein